MTDAERQAFRHFFLTAWIMAAAPAIGSVVKFHELWAYLAAIAFAGVLAGIGAGGKIVWDRHFPPPAIPAQPRYVRAVLIGVGLAVLIIGVAILAKHYSLS